MRFAFLLLLASPAFADDPHSGVVHTRSGPEVSDIALFVMAAGGVWAARRAMRARWAKRRAPERD
jgi:hypothetical protein